jgi:hypothetical protein
MAESPEEVGFKRMPFRTVPSLYVCLSEGGHGAGSALELGRYFLSGRVFCGFRLGCRVCVSHLRRTKNRVEGRGVVLLKVPIWESRENPS